MNAHHERNLSAPSAHKVNCRMARGANCSMITLDFLRRPGQKSAKSCRLLKFFGTFSRFMTLNQRKLYARP